MTKIKEKNVGGCPRHPTWEAFYEGIEMANQSHKWVICKFAQIIKKLEAYLKKCGNILFLVNNLLIKIFFGQK